jgi:hypothetical protein
MRPVRRSTSSWAREQFANIAKLPGGCESLPGGWKLRRNPNWVDKPVAVPDDFDAHSLVPTELVSSVGDRDIDDDSVSSSSVSTSSDSSDYFVHNVLNRSEPVATIFNIPKDEMDRIRMHAERRGLHTGMLHRPIQDRTPSLRREDSWWMVLGGNQEVVTHVLDMQDRTLPGFVGKWRPWVYAPNVMPFVQFAVAGAVGGLVVWIGLSTM